MHDHTRVIEDNPGAFVVSGDAQWTHAVGLGLLHDGVRDRSNLPVGVAFADDEIVSDRRLLADVDPNDLSGLLVCSRVRDEPAQLKGSHWPDYPS